MLLPLNFTMKARILLCIVSLGFSLALVQAADSIKDRVAVAVDKELPSLVSLYKHFHSNPELSFMEAETAKRLAAELGEAGLQLTPSVGGHGLVGVLKNGDGPTLLIRADMDGLPVQEETGLPHASKKQMTDGLGNMVYTMHACGHDVHMTSFVGTNSRLRDELLKVEIFSTLAKARVLGNEHRRYYNEMRPHSSLGGKSLRVVYPKIIHKGIMTYVNVSR